MFTRFLTYFLAVLTVFFLSTGSVLAQTTTPEVARVEGPTFIAEDSVLLNGVYAGPVFALGGQVTFAGDVEQDLVVAGGTVRLRGTAEQDVYAAGGTVIIDGQVHGNVVAAGGEVQLTENARVDGSMVVGTERLNFLGHLNGPLYVGANRVLLDGQLGSDAWIGGETVVLGETASISGSLHAQVAQPLDTHQTASVAGTTDVQIQPPQQTEDDHSWKSRVLRGLFMTLWRFLLLSVLLFFLFPILKKATQQLANKPGDVLVKGVIGLITLPLLMLLLLLTMVGAPIAGLLFLTYVLVLLTAWIVPSLWVGERLLPGQNPYLQALAGVAMVAAVSLLPIFGPIILLFIAALGVGSVLSWFSPTKRSNESL